VPIGRASGGKEGRAFTNEFVPLSPSVKHFCDICGLRSRAVRRRRSATAADILITPPPPIVTDRRAAAAGAADRMSASRRRRFRDVFTSCCTCYKLLDFCNAVYNEALTLTKSSKNDAGVFCNSP